MYVGADDVKGDVDEVVNIERPHDRLEGADQIGKKDTVAKAIQLPKTIEEVCLLSENKIGALGDQCMLVS